MSGIKLVYPSFIGLLVGPLFFIIAAFMDQMGIELDIQFACNYLLCYNICDFLLYSEEKDI